LSGASSNNASDVVPSSTDGSAKPSAPSDGKPFSEKEVTLPAVIIDKPQPSYPLAARQQHATGAVKLRVVFSPSGEVTEVEALRRVNGLTEAAMQVAKSIKFLPAEKDGRFVPQYAEVEYEFVIF
jgi:TonB family protein